MGQVAATPFDVEAVRARFPALTRRDADGRAFVFADAPGGTQVPDAVIEAMSEYLRRSNANAGGPFATSRETDATIEASRRAAATVVGGAPEEVVFGPNMTTLAFAVSRSIGRTLGAGDEIVVTRLDHDANVAPWLLAAEDAGATVRWADVRPKDAAIDLGTLAGCLGSLTRVVAFTLASNATGTVTPTQEVVELVRDRAPAALMVADAVHYAQHRPLDVRALGVDLLFCSPYKFFGPHMGLMWARPELIAGLRPYKVRPAHDEGPDRWETGTKSHEAMAGLVAAVDYLAWLGRTFRPEGGAGGPGAGVGDESTERRAAIVAGMEAARAHETELTERFLAAIREVPAVRVFGISDPARAAERTPTFAVRLGAEHPSVTAAALGERGIFVWDGDYYAYEVMRRLGLAGSGGAVRIGFCHYATREEVDRVVGELLALA
jgi:cysteine desulfurase family protein (TIGR01976 family)